MGVYAKPYATSYSTSETPTVPTVQGATAGASTYWEQEKGTDEVIATGATTAIVAYVESGDYDIGSAEGEQGEGEFMMRISRIIPDYGAQTGDSRITLSTKAFPSSTAVATNHTATTSTTQLFTRSRARQIAIKVGNTGTGETGRMGKFRHIIF